MKAKIISLVLSLLTVTAVFLAPVVSSASEMEADVGIELTEGSKAIVDPGPEPSKEPGSKTVIKPGPKVPVKLPQTSSSASHGLLFTSVGLLLCIAAVSFMRSEPRERRN